MAYPPNYPGYSEGGDLGCGNAVINQRPQAPGRIANTSCAPPSHPEPHSLSVGERAVCVQGLSCLLLDRLTTLYDAICTGPANQAKTPNVPSAPPMGLIERLQITTDAIEQAHARISAIAGYLGFEV